MKRTLLKKAATQVGVPELSDLCRLSCGLQHRFDKLAMKAALLMSQQGRFHLNTGLCHQAWDWSTYLLTQQPASKACHSVSWAK